MDKLFIPSFFNLHSVNKTILKIAIPAIATNISIPLLSLVDMMIVGHMSNVAYIGAIAVGGALYNLIYWNFGFLRMGNSGLTAQAYGAKDPAVGRAHLKR